MSVYHVSFKFFIRWTRDSISLLAKLAKAPLKGCSKKTAHHRARKRTEKKRIAWCVRSRARARVRFMRSSSSSSSSYFIILSQPLRVFFTSHPRCFVHLSLVSHKKKRKCQKAAQKRGANFQSRRSLERERLRESERKLFQTRFASDPSVLFLSFFLGVCSFLSARRVVLDRREEEFRSEKETFPFRIGPSKNAAETPNVCFLGQEQERRVRVVVRVFRFER